MEDGEGGGGVGDEGEDGGDDVVIFFAKDRLAEGLLPVGGPEDLWDGSGDSEELGGGF